MKYNYKGIPLDVYCEMYDLNFKTQSNRIREFKKKHPGVGDDEATIIVLDSYDNFSVQNMALCKYCKIHDLDYLSVKDLAKELRDEYQMSSNEACLKAISEVEASYKMYFYLGMPLIQYCKIHSEYKYSDILKYIRKNSKKEVDINIIIETYFANKKVRTFYFVDDIPLKQYCVQNNLDYRSVLLRIMKMRKDDRFKNFTVDEIVKIALEGPIGSYFYCYLYYQNKTLYQYCRENDIPYKSVFNALKRILDNEPDVMLEEAIDRAVKIIRKWRICHSYNNMSIKEYALKEGLNLRGIQNRIGKNLCKMVSEEEAVFEAITYYQNKKKYCDLNDLFEYLKNNDEIDGELLDKIINYLNIDLENVNFLKEYFLKIRDIINFIWYFHDNLEGEKLSVSKVKVLEMLECQKKLEQGVFKEFLEFDLVSLIGFYKVGLFDTRCIIIAKEKNYLCKLVWQEIKNYGLEVSRNTFDELVDELMVFLLELIEKNNMNDIFLIVGYLKKSLKGHLMKLVYNDFSFYNNIAYLDYKMIEGSEEDFKDDLWESLCDDVSALEKDFIFYKYQKRLSNREIANYLNVSGQELVIMEQVLLNKLQNNRNIRKLAQQKRMVRF